MKTEQLSVVGVPVAFKIFEILWRENYVMAQKLWPAVKPFLVGSDWRWNWLNLLETKHLSNKVKTSPAAMLVYK